MKVKDRNIIIISLILIIVLGTIAVTIGSVSLSSIHVWKILVNKLSNKDIFSIE